LTLVAALVCAPLLVLGSALVFMLLMMLDRPGQPAAPGVETAEPMRRAA
jgi:hypothetical protein